MRLFDNIYLVAGSALNSDPGDANTYAVDGGDHIVLIDSGGGYNVDGMYTEMAKDGLDHMKIGMIINTHCHFDHTGGNKRVRDDTGCKTAIHETEVEAIEKNTELTVAEIWNHELEPCPVDIPLKGDEIFTVGPYPLQLMHVPGHTPGSIVISFMHNNRKMCFIGDCLSLLDLPGESRENLIDSLNKLLAERFDILMTGHDGPVVEDPQPFIQGYLDQVK